MRAAAAVHGTDKFLAGDRHGCRGFSRCAVQVVVLTFLFAWVATRADAQTNYYYLAPVADFPTTSATFTPVTGCSLSFTPGSTSENWLVMATGQVRSSSTSDPQAAHVQMLVQGTAEAEGGVQNSPADAETGFFMMHRITGTTASQTIDVEAQDPFANLSTTTVEQCSITAFLVPSAADFQWTEVDGVSGNCLDTPDSTILTHTLNPTSSAGDYLSIVSFVSFENPGGATNKSWITYPSGAEVPDFNVENAWGIARDARQTNVSMREETLPASPQNLTVMCDGSLGNSTILWAKVASFRMDAFEADYHDEDLTEVTLVTSSTWATHSTVTQAAPAASAEFVMLGTISGCDLGTVSGPQHGMRFREDSTLQGDSVWGITRECLYAEAFHNTLQWVEPYTTASSKTWDNQYQSTDNLTEARFAESAIHVLQFPVPDHVVVTATDGSATAGDTEVLSLQLVDQSGTPVDGALAVTVTVTGSATFSANNIGGTNGTATLNGTLSATGAGSVTITDGVAETVTVSADATGDAQVVANVDDTVTFNPLPVLAVDDGRLFYGETGTAQALNRAWDESLGTWSAEGGTAPVSGTVRWTVNKVAPDGSEDLLGVLSDTGSGAELNLVRWDGTAWTVDWSSTAITSANLDKRGFDLEYEASSGDALVVYSDNTDTPVYRTRSGGSWSGETPLPLNDGAGPNPDPNTGIVHWVELTPRLGSDEITLAYVDANWDLVAIVWEGTQWLTASASALETDVTQSRGTPNVIHNRPVDVAYEETTGDALIAWGRHSVNGFFYSTRAAGSSSWSAATGVLAPTSGDSYFVDLAAEPGGQHIAGAFMDLGNGTERLGLATWTGSAWVNPGEYDSQTRDVNDLAPGDVVAAVGWLGTSGTAVAVYSDNDVDTIDWATWTAGGGWVLQADVTPAITGKGYTESVQIEMFGTQNELMAIFSGSNADLYAATYDGATWTVTNSGSALETVLSSVDSAPFSFAIGLLTAAITGTSPASLTESNLNGATVTVETNGSYNASLLTTDFSLNGAPVGTTINSVVRDSATQATLTLAFDGTDFDSDATMSVTVLASALAVGPGPVTTGDVTVTAVLEVSAAITGTTPGSLTETNLNGATVTVTLTDGTYDDPLATGDFTLNGAPAGTTINSVVRDSATQATLTLAFDGTDFDTNASMSVTVLQAALATGTGPATTGTVTITAVVEVNASITGTTPASLTESNLNGATVTVTITDGTYDDPLVTTDFTLNGAPAGTTINSVVRDSATQATLTLAFDGTDFDTNASMSVTVLQAALATGTGPATTGTVTVTAVDETDLQQLHYRWRNDDGGEGTAPLEATATVDTPGETSATDVLVPGMTLTPGAGDYLVWFSGSIENSQTAAVETNYVSLYVAGTQVAHTERAVSADDSIPNTAIPVGFQARVAGVGGADDIEVKWRTTGGTMTMHERTLVVEPITLADVSQASATADTPGETSPTDVLVPDMTLTPGAGDYLVWFSGSLVADTGDSTQHVSLYVNGSQVAHTERQSVLESSIVNTPLPVGFQAKVTGVGALDDIEVMWRTSAGTATMHQRTLVVQKITAADVSEASAIADTPGETSPTDVLVPGMTLTPGAGDYLVWFSGSIDGAVPASDEIMHVSLYVAGTQVAHTERQIKNEGSLDNLPNSFPVMFQAHVTGVGASDDIEVKWRTSAGTATMHERTLALQLTSGASWATAEDTALTGLATTTLKRLRIEMSNEGGATASGIQFRLEVTGALSTASPGTCAAASYFTLPTAHWEIVGSGNVTDGAATVNLLTVENTAFVAGQTKDAGNQTTGITLTSADFTEIEYAVQATASATAGALYCFRLTNAGSTTDFTDPYPQYAQVTIDGVDNFSVEAAGGGAIGTQYKDLAFNIQVTARDYLGTTVSSFGGTAEITSTGNLSGGSGTTGAFSSGVLASHSVTISNPGDFTITATDTPATGTSNTFTVNDLKPFGFRKAITIDRNHVPGTCQATVPDFPLLFSVTHLDLSTASGQVTDPEGDDILFRALDDTACGGVGLAPCTLDHEIEAYDGTTGTVVAWVRVPSLNTTVSASDTVIYVYYGNSDITSSIENVSGVWDTDYVGVWHLEESPANGVAGHDESTGNPTDATPLNFGGVAGSTTDATGQIGGADDLDGVDDHVNASNDGPVNDLGPMTISTWVKPDTYGASNAPTVVRKDNGSSVGRWLLEIDNTAPEINTIAFVKDHATTDIDVASANNVVSVGTGTWHHIVATWDGSVNVSGVHLYVNGQETGYGATQAAVGAPVSDAAESVIFGARGDAASALHGFMDEVRLSKIARDACWIEASYNNQVWPDKAVTPTPDPSPNPDSGFITLGVEEPGPLTAVELVTFTATGYDHGVLLEWETGYEVDNLGFHVYREVGGERIPLTPSLIAGTGLLAERGMAVASAQAYAWWDLEVTAATDGIAYWLEDVDFDGMSTWHGPVTPVDGGHLIDVGPPAEDEGVRGSNSRSLQGLGQGRGAQRRRFLAGARAAGGPGRPELPGRQTPLASQWTIAGQPAVKLGIEEAGWYRVTQGELVAAGLDPTVDPRRLHLVVDGLEQALRVTGAQDGRFDPGDAIEFYGEGVDTAYTGTRVYWLVAGVQPGLRMGEAPRGAVGGGPKGASAAASFWGTVEQKDRSIYFAALRNGEAENWFGPLVWAWPTDVVVPISNLDPAAPSAAALEVRLQGVTRMEATPDHTVAVLVNGTEVGELLFDGRTSGVKTFPVPHAVLQEGANTVRLIARGAGWDFSLVDTLRLSYWHTYRADADRLRFAVDGGETVTVGGFASGAIEVVDVTTPGAVAEVSSTVEATRDGFWAATVQVPGTGRRTLLAFSEATVGPPAFVAANRPSNWHAATQAHDYLVVTHARVAEALGLLMALRAREGYGAALVEIEDVYDEFSFGQKTPQALKDFLTRAQTSWRRAPRFVVLAGDATIDPRDYAGFGDADLVPTKLVAMDSVELESATDEWFADLDEDGLGELALGRLPMRTVEQAEAMVAKLVAYEAADAGAWTKQVVLLADEDEPAWSFEADGAQLKALLPPGYTTHEVWAGAGVGAARGALFDLVGQGQLLVNYLGHGSTYVWGKHANLLTSGDVTTQWQPQAGLPLVLAMNCLNGFFQGIYGEESLAETFLRAPGGGAVGVWASSSVTHARPQAVANRAFVEQVFGGVVATVGEAMAAAKGVVADRDVRRSWIFFGDPALRLKGVPGPRAGDGLLFTAAEAPGGLVHVGDAAEFAEPDPPDPMDEPANGGETTAAAATTTQLADFDGDGRTDVFLYEATTGLWHLALSEPQAFRYHSGQWAPGLQLVAAQLTDDGLADVFGYHAQTGAWVQALNHLTQADGADGGAFTAHPGVWASGARVALGDLDGDGRDDVLLSDPATGAWVQSLTDGAGGFTYRGGRGLPTGQVQIADFNGDTLADLFVYDAASGRWVLGVNDGAGSFAAATGDGAPGWRVQVANLDGNSWADLFLNHPPTGTWVEWLTSPSGRITYESGQWAPGGPLQVVDLDGDGRDDLVSYDPATGAWVSHLSHPSGRFKEAAGVWAPGAQVAVGDLDGDGREDLFLYDAASGAWWRQVSDGRGGFTETSGNWSLGWTLVGQPN